MTQFMLFLKDEEATQRFAQALAPLLQKGDVIALEGDLGTGTSPFARIPVWHLDLYRLTDPEEALELGIEETWIEGISLIEWPQNLGPLLPSSSLHLTFQEGKEIDERLLCVTLPDSPSSWQEKFSSLSLSSWAMPEESFK